MSTKSKIQVIAETTVTESFFNYFYNKKPVSTNHIVLKHVFPNEYLIRSSIGGLETSLGTQLWEKLATEIASQNGFTVLDPKHAIMQPQTAIATVSSFMDTWHTARCQPNSNKPLSEYKRELQILVSGLQAQKNFKPLKKGDGVDLFLSKNGVDYAFDIKTVQWNAKFGTAANSTLLNWLAFHKLMKPNTELRAYFVVPYDPTVVGWWQKFSGRAYPLDSNDVLVADAFWDLLSGANGTLTEIEKGFISIANSSFRKIYTLLLSDNSEAARLPLLEYCRNVSYIGDRDLWKKSGRTIFEWQCQKCSGNFKAKSMQLAKEEISCPQCAVTATMSTY